MIVITGQIFTDQETLPDLYARLKAFEEPTRVEDGCIFYHMAMQDESEGIILATEGWRDREALNTHLALPQIAKLLSDFAGKYRNEVSLHDVSATESMSV